MFDDQTQNETIHKARMALMELQLTSMAEVISTIGTVYRSRIKVDAFDLVKAYSEQMEKEYRRMDAKRDKQLRKQAWRQLFKYLRYRRRKHQRERRADRKYEN